MPSIRNTDALRKAGNAAVRQPLLDIANETLQTLNSARLIPTLMRVDGTRLIIGECSWDLARYARIFVIGAGKAGNHMARAVDAILGERISWGLVVVKQLEEADKSVRHIELALGGHPYPNRSGWEATRKILAKLEGCDAQTLVLTVFSGGSSALMNYPVEGVTLEEERELTKLLLTAGANILEINTVRRHVSAVNGGRLAQRLASTGAEVVNLVLSDRVDDKAVGTPSVPVSYTGTQIGLDPTTFDDARVILRRYNLEEKIPASILAHLANAAGTPETPKAPLPRQHTFVIQGLTDACDAALDSAKKAGIPAYVLTSVLEGDSRQAGFFLGAIAREIRYHQRPFPSPCLLIAAGETTVRIDGPAGLGGPSQELAAAFAHQIDGLKDIAIIALETEGTDGPTTLAGALTDDTTASRARREGQNLLDALKFHDCCPLLTRLNDHLVTGNTGTNLCDLNLVYIK